MKEIRKIIEDYDFNKSFLKCSIVSVVNVEGSSYRRVGARMIVYENGLCLGGISGGCLEGDALRKAQKVIYSNKPTLVRYDTTTDDGHQIGVGLGCRGIIDVLIVPIDRKDPNNQIEVLRKCMDKRYPQVILTIIEQKQNKQLAGSIKLYAENREITDVCHHDFHEAIERTFISKTSTIYENEIAKVSLQYLPPDMHLIMMGHQYDTLPMTKLANELGWFTTIYGNKHRMHRASMLEANQVLDTKEDLPAMDEHTAIILMSHDYKTDLKNLNKIIDKDVSYIGILGPRVRGQDLLEDYGINVQDMDRLNIYSPAGLDTGADTPEEIALSILAEIRTHFSKRQGGHLKERMGFIHEREC